MRKRETIFCNLWKRSQQSVQAPEGDTEVVGKVLFSAGQFRLFECFQQLAEVVLQRIQLLPGRPQGDVRQSDGHQLKNSRVEGCISAQEVEKNRSVEQVYHNVADRLDT